MMRIIAATLMAAELVSPAVAGEGGSAPLSAYVGHPPFERVAGVTSLEHPAVRDAVRRALADARVRKWLLVASNSPSPPIHAKDGAIVSFGCQWHGCDRRHWAILIDPKGRRAQVCYYSGSGDGARWYAGDGRSAMRDEECPSQS
jgi:hypothetical protein